MRCLKSWCSASAGPSRTARRLAPAALLAWLCTAGQAAGPDQLAVGADHYFNQEYAESVAAFRRYAEAEPGDPNAQVQLTKAMLYQELMRIRAFDTGAFGDDRQFREGDKPKSDPRVRAAIQATIKAGIATASARLAEDPSDRLATHSLARLHALRGVYELLIGKEYFRALASGRRAKELSYRLVESDPDFVDGQLVAGVNEYMLGSLPWAVRMLIALSGYRGSKKKGLAMIEQVARQGGEARHDARMLLALAYRRERRLHDAAREFQSLAADFPRAYLYPLEQAAMHRAAGEKRAAFEILREVSRKVDAAEGRFDRMPERWASALRRTVRKLAAEVGADDEPLEAPA